MTPRDRWRTSAASSFLVGLLVAGVLAVASPARAQLVAPQGTTIDTQLWQPAIGPRNFLTVENTAVAEHKLLGFGLSLNYQRHPYILYTEGYTTGSSNLVDSQTTTELQASMGLFGKYQAGIAIPFTLYLAGDEVDAMGMPINYRLSETGIGDLRLEGKALVATLGEDEEYTVGRL
jgi:hypothetical protein